MNLEDACSAFMQGYFSTNTRREKTKAAYKCDLAQFLTFSGKTFDLTAVRHTHIEGWAGWLQNRGYSPASVRRKIVILKVFCSYWVRNGLLTESPFWRVQITFGKILQLPRTLSEEEVYCLLSYSQRGLSGELAKPTDKDGETYKRAWNNSLLAVRNVALLELLFATGMRVGEVSALNLEDFQVAEASFRVRGKGGRERMAFVVDDISLKAQLTYLAVRRQILSADPALFVNASGRRLSSQGIANVIQRLRKESGVDRHVTPHMLRHTVATLLLRNGVDIRVVQEFLGHASIATTQRYTHVAKEHLIRELQGRHPSITFRASV